MKTYCPEPQPTTPSLAWALVGEPLQRFIAHVFEIVDQAFAETEDQRRRKRTDKEAA